uniref:Uncharacterized protein n=1 Tax=Glossina palpalis gambiensis TaxID=67801 RepID=A0A1B0BE20_9MUSC
MYKTWNVICHVYSESEMQTNAETHAHKNSQHLRGCHSFSWLSYSENYSRSKHGRSYWSGNVKNLVKALLPIQSSHAYLGLS